MAHGDDRFDQAPVRKRRARYVLCVLAAALMWTALTVSPSMGSGAVPVPEQDPFYDVPSNVATYSPGAVIASRPVSATAYVVPLPAAAWQVKYATTDALGNPTATVTTVLVPTGQWPGSGSRPLVSYQTAEDGVAGKCAPSHALQTGVLGGNSNSADESGLILLALQHGWAVTVPDYEGRYSHFLAGPEEGYGVLDAVRATLAFGTAGLDPQTKVGLWGYSGGSVASSAALELQPTYAPDLHFSGAALGGLVGDIRSTIDKFSGSALGGAVAMGVNGFLRAYPGAHIEQYLSASGLMKVQATAGDCINDAAMRYPFLSTSQIEAYPNALSTPAVASLLRANSPLGIAGTPSTAIYDYHAVLDEFAPIGPDRQLMKRFCGAGVTIQHVEDLLAEHISETITGAPGAMAFLADRFAGKAPTNNCSSIASA